MLKYILKAQSLMKTLVGHGQTWDFPSDGTGTLQPDQNACERPGGIMEYSQVSRVIMRDVSQAPTSVAKLRWSISHIGIMQRKPMQH